MRQLQQRQQQNRPLMTPARHAARCLASHDDAAASSSTIVEIRLRPTTTAAALSLDPSLDATRRLEYRLQGSFYFTYSVRPSYYHSMYEYFIYMRHNMTGLSSNETI